MSRGVGTPVRRLQTGRFGLFADDIHAKLDAFITDEHGRPGDQLTHLMLAFAAKGTVKRILAVAARVVRHRLPLPQARRGV
jgi:hypothetical protein